MGNSKAGALTACSYLNRRHCHVVTRSEFDIKFVII